MPNLKASAPSRLISVSSIGHARDGLVLDDLMIEKRKYDKWGSYSAAKTANILLAMEVQRRVGKDGVLALSLRESLEHLRSQLFWWDYLNLYVHLDPGGIMTGLQEHMDPEEFRAMGWVNEKGELNPRFKSIEQGTSTHLYATLEPSLVNYGGKKP